MPSELAFRILQEADLQKHGLAPFIDHTLLKPEAEPKHIEKLCSEALEHKFAGVCVNSSFVGLAASCLRGSPQMVISVIGFPLGANDPRAVVFEAECAWKDGAKELDMVLPIGRLKAGQHAEVLRIIQAVAKASPCPLKVIIETGLLTDDEKKVACQLSAEAGARFVKTCTGFNGGAASVDDVRLMKAVVGDGVGVKASGGIRSFEAAVALLLAGGHRLGTSSGVGLVNKVANQSGY